MFCMYLFPFKQNGDAQKRKAEIKLPGEVFKTNMSVSDAKKKKNRETNKRNVKFSIIFNICFFEHGTCVTRTHTHI